MYACVYVCMHACMYVCICPTALHRATVEKEKPDRVWARLKSLMTSPLRVLCILILFWVLHYIIIRRVYIWLDNLPQLMFFLYSTTTRRINEGFPATATGRCLPHMHNMHSELIRARDRQLHYLSMAHRPCTSHTVYYSRTGLNL